jgi:CHAT domain-containing protein
VQAAIATFPHATVLPDKQATREAVLAALLYVNVLHCSCHGNANLTEPLTSGLQMTGDGEAAILTLKDLLDLRLTESGTGGIHLAVLSACETGLQGIGLADEAISLPTGLLQAGVAGVVASLWSVSERSTMMLLVKFYDLWRNQGLDSSLALHQAQHWLRDSTDGEKADYFRFHTLDRKARSYAHPYYWGAFSYVGV